MEEKKNKMKTYQLVLSFFIVIVIIFALIYAFNKQNNIFKDLLAKKNAEMQEKLEENKGKELDFNSDIVQTIFPLTGAFPGNDMRYIASIKNMNLQNITNDFILKLDRIDGGLNHGQILYYDGHLAVRFEIMPTMCLEFECRGFSQIARLAYEIGNLHAPLFFAPFSDGILLIVPEDYILAKYFYNRGFKIERRWHILEPKMRFSLSFALPKEPRVVLSENFSITKV